MVSLRELDGDYFDRLSKASKVNHMARRPEKLMVGSVPIEIQPAAA